MVCSAPLQSHFNRSLCQRSNKRLSLRRGKLYARKAVKIPPAQFYSGFCEICGTGDGIITCPRCQGLGKVTTKPGGAGVPFYVGSARCKLCNGQGRVPCPLCAGFEVPLPPPQPFREAKETLQGRNSDDGATVTSSEY